MQSSATTQCKIALILHQVAASFVSTLQSFKSFVKDAAFVGFIHILSKGNEKTKREESLLVFIDQFSKMAKVLIMNYIYAAKALGHSLTRGCSTIALRRYSK